jgi:hypothetical protein
MHVLALKYRNGDEIMRDDQVLFHGRPAKVEFVAIAADDPDPAVAWHVRDSGGGVMILDPTVSGRTFIPRDMLHEYEDLEFVARG